MENQNNKLVLGSIAGLLILSAVALAFYCFIGREKADEEQTPPLTETREMMPLFVYVQDKSAAETSDCAKTIRVKREVPKTTGVADASLKILFAEELASYGKYSSVALSNGVAKVILESDRTPAGKPFSSLSSCESGHLMSVLRDTLLQYKTIQKVELHSPSGIIEF